MTTEPTTLEGLFERRVVLEGSRSERPVPVLVVTDEGGAERVVRVHVIGDESYSEAALDAWVGKRVRVGPGMWRNRVLRVQPSDIRMAMADERAREGKP